MTVQAAQGQILVDVLDEIRDLHVELARFQCSSPLPPFDDGFLLPFDIPSQKGGVHIESTLFLLSGGEYFFVGWSLWS